MKSINLFQLILSLVFILLLTSCTQEIDLDQQETSSFKIIPLSQNKSSIYTDNYKVSEQTTTIDIANDKITLEIPIPENDFQLLRVYNISTTDSAAVLYLIGRGDTNEVAQNPIDYVIQDEISISELGLDTNLLQNENGLRIFVMNNSLEIDTNSTIYNCLLDSVENKVLQANCNSKNAAADGPLIFGEDIVFL